MICWPRSWPDCPQGSGQTAARFLSIFVSYETNLGGGPLSKILTETPAAPRRPWARVVLAALLFLPTPLIAAYPSAAAFLGETVLGVPAYLLLFLLLAESNSGFAARMEG